MPDEPTPTDQNQAPNPEPTPAVEPKPNKVAARINQLYGQAKEAEELAGVLQEENATLRTQVDELAGRLNALEAAAPIPPDGTPVVKHDSGHVTEEKVVGWVQKAVGSVLETKAQDNRNAQALKQSQVQSWQAAVSQFPELKDQNSDLYKAANSIWSKDGELQGSTTGPLKAAIMARGMLDAPPPVAPVAAATAAGNVSGANSGSADSQLKEVEAQLEEVTKNLHSGSYIGEAWVKYQNLKQKRAALLKQKKG